MKVLNRVLGTALVLLLLALAFSLSARAATVTSSLTTGTLTLDKPGPVTLTWTATGAGRCIASGDWSGSKNVIGGTETVQVTKTSTFALACESPTGPAKVIWTPDPSYADGSTASLKGFVIFSGTSATALARLLDVPGGTNTSAQVQVPPGLTYFVIRQVDANDKESIDSSVVSKNVVADKATATVTVTLQLALNPAKNVQVQ